MITVYILKLEHGKYYIGKTTRPIFRRITEHFYENGSEWTKHYKPIHVLEVIDNANEFDEDKYTKIYMKKHGIDNVRGGSYTRTKLLDYQLKNLQDEFCTVNNLCFKCNKPGHFAKDCKIKTTKVVDNVCFKCNKPGHFAKNCKVKTTKKLISDDVFDILTGVFLTDTNLENKEWKSYKNDEYYENAHYDYSEFCLVLNLVNEFIVQNNYNDEYDSANLCKIKSNNDLKCILNTLLDNSKQRIENYENLIYNIKQNITWEALTDIVIMLNKNELKKTGIPLFQNLNNWYMKKYCIEYDDIDVVISSYEENLSVIKILVERIWRSGGCPKYKNGLKSELESIERNMNRLGYNYFSFIFQVSDLCSRINVGCGALPTNSSFSIIKRAASDFCKPNFVLKDNSFFKFLEKAYTENDYESYSHNLSWYY